MWPSECGKSLNQAVFLVRFEIFCAINEIATKNVLFKMIKPEVNSYWAET